MFKPKLYNLYKNKLKILKYEKNKKLLIMQVISLIHGIIFN